MSFYPAAKSFFIFEIILIFAADIYATPNLDPNLLQKKISQTTTSPMPTCNNCTDPTYQAIVRECVETLCPDAHFSYGIYVNKLVLQFRQKQKHEILELYNDYRRQDLQRQINEIDSFIADFDESSLEKVQLPSIYLTVIRLILLTRKIDEFKLEYDDQTQKLILNEQESEAAFKGLNPKSKKTIIDVVKQLINSFDIQLIKLSGLDNDQLKLLYSPQELQSLAQSKTEEMSTLSEKIKISNPPLYHLLKILDFPLKIESFKARLKLNVYSLNLLSDINSYLAFIKWFNTILNTNSDLGISSNELDSFFNLLNDKEILKLAKKLKEAIKFELERKTHILTLPNQCFENAVHFFSLAENNLKSKQEHKENYQKEYLSFMHKTKNLLSTATHAEFAQISRNWSNVDLQTKEDYLRYVKEVVDSYSFTNEDDSLINNNIDKKFGLNFKVITQEHLAELQKPESERDIEHSFSDIESVCEETALNLINDSTSRDDKVLRSHMTNHHHPHLEGITHHELAHKLDYFMQSLLKGQKTKPSAHSLDWYHKRVACLIREEGQFVAEDFADLIGEYDRPLSKSFGCFRNRKVDPIEYKELFLNYPKEKTGGAHHSPDLYRLLHTAVTKKQQLPTSCEQILAQTKPKVEIQNCLEN